MIFHLTVIIVLLLYQIDSTVRREESFVIDFSKQEEIERQKKEQTFKEDISKRIDDLIAASRKSGEPIRNIAVDAGSKLKDDRNTDADQLYKDAERLAQDLKAGQLEDAREETVELEEQRTKKKEDPKKKEYSGPLKDDRGTDAEQLYKDAERLAQDLKNGQKSNAFDEKYSDETVDLGGGKKDGGNSDKVYSGPSVLSYTLDGRKASKLPIPAYRCYAGGEVTVIIVVNPQGVVIGAEVKDDISSTDQCLRNFAVRAARLSRFSQSSTAPARQTGEIVYRFIAQ